MLPELVRREDLAAASALNGIEFNIARAVGPALAGGLIAIAGVGAAFLVNVVSFAGVILVIARWKRPVRVRTAPAESIGGATVAALRYIRYAPTARGLMLRAGAVMFCASAPFALLPTVAHRISGDASGTGSCWDASASARSLGAVVMQAARTRWTTEAVSSISVAILGGTIVTLSLMHTLPGLMLTLVVSGGAWLTFISLANALVQNLAPDWVRARVLALFMLVTQGGLAAGSALWGAVGSNAGVDTALLWAGLGHDRDDGARAGGAIAGHDR